ncbi:hypothetical protein [Photobacterium damselae]|uniref:hypothetical protein n=1 Tax=Photobacterium damselae TaxID=38293 RepID=UPI001F230FBC|nr:hypothetical protein [Photobacterium damselae]UKA04530.1 hypothetical protein IHC89_23190 [Photobacterium damselae subsp. damselae]
MKKNDELQKRLDEALDDNKALKTKIENILKLLDQAKTDKKRGVSAEKKTIESSKFKRSEERSSAVHQDCFSSPLTNAMLLNSIMDSDSNGAEIHKELNPELTAVSDTSSHRPQLSPDTNKSESNNNNEITHHESSYTSDSSSSYGSDSDSSSIFSSDSSFSSSSSSDSSFSSDSSSSFGSDSF